FGTDPWRRHNTGLNRDALLAASGVDPNTSTTPCMVCGGARNASGPCCPLGSAFDTANDLVDLGIVTRLAALGQANAQRLVGAACTWTAFTGALL
ncbi:hypothetical protein, partial [Xanthomonas vesicatoria]|uniref:hypothetical protein n=1 Tax=Xanthomonas vesicatoria TaxID=56460 RepID=UPI001C12ABBD